MSSGYCDTAAAYSGALQLRAKGLRAKPDQIMHGATVQGLRT